MNCTKQRCYSPVACEGFGYCREINFVWEEITLRCPKCKRTKQAAQDPSDPTGTAVVEVTCDRCDDGGGFPEIHYYDAKGRWFDGEKFL
jgi:hypothetical protein